MTLEAQRLLQQARRLSDRERASLASALLRTLDDDDAGEELSREEWERAWGEELKRRVEEVRSGKAKLLDGASVLRRVKASLKRSK